MIKFLAGDNLNIYGFGLTEANLNRLQFNNEPIFFDFGYASHPELFGLILYLDEFETLTDMVADMNTVLERAVPFFDPERGVGPGSLRLFPIAQSMMQTFRHTPFRGFETHIEITGSGDRQIFFAGPDERGIEQYFQKHGFIAPDTKRIYKGFGRRDE